MACNGIWFLLSSFPEQLCTETTVTCSSEYTVATNSKLNSACMSLTLILVFIHLSRYSPREVPTHDLICLAD